MTQGPFSLDDPLSFRRQESGASSKVSLTSPKSPRTCRGLNKGLSGPSHKLVVDPEEIKEDKRPSHRLVFVDAEEMKEKVRNRLCRPVVDNYKEEGCAQSIARSMVFEQASLAVIAFNAIWISVDTDYNGAQMLLDAHLVFQIAEHLFCLFFSFEWIVRFLAFKRKSDTLYDKAFCFDSALVLLMVAETWVLTAWALISGSGTSGDFGNASVLRVARLLRLTRMARMARLLRAMPELMILVKGMVAAMRSVFFTLLLLLMVTYVFGISFTQMLEDSEIGTQHFKNVPLSMYTLLIYGTLLDEVGMMAKLLGSENFIFAALFFLFILLAALTVMNMLIGVLCEVVSAVAATEREEMFVNHVHRQVRNVLEQLDADGGGTISRDEFVHILDNRDAIRALQDVGVDVVSLVDFADVIFEDDEDLSFSKFMEVVLQLRGSNIATVKDIVDLRKFVRSEFRLVTSAVDRVDSQFRAESSQMALRLSESMHELRVTSQIPSIEMNEERQSKHIAEGVLADPGALGDSNPAKNESSWNDYNDDEAKDGGMPILIQASASTALLTENTNDSIQSEASQVAVPCESEIYQRHTPYHELNYEVKGHWSPLEVANPKGNGHWIPCDTANLIGPNCFQGMASTPTFREDAPRRKHSGRCAPSFSIAQEAAQICIKDVMCSSHQHPAAFCPSQLDDLRGQMAALGKLMTLGLREVSKIQDNLRYSSSTSTTPMGKF